MNTKNPGDYISSDSLAKCHVTLCRSKGKNFWLITEFKPQRSRCLSIQNANVNIDLLLKIWEKRGLDRASAYFMSIINGDIIGSSLEAIFSNGVLTKGSAEKVQSYKTKIDIMPDSDIEQLLSVDEQVELSGIDIEDIIDNSEELNWDDL